MRKCVYAAYSEEDGCNFVEQFKGLWDVYLTLDNSKIIDILTDKSCDFVILDAESGGFFLPDVVDLIKRSFPHLHIFIIIHCKQDERHYNLLDYNVSAVFELPRDLKDVYEKIETFFTEGVCRSTVFNYTKNDENVEILKDKILGISNSAFELRAFILRAADSSLPVLLSGETGCGKSLAANLIHKLSKIKAKKFTSINVSCVPESLAESFFFGTEKGSFTGAVKKEGAFYEAEGGTIFLDEMETLSPDIQAKLLHVLESGLIRPVGSTESKKVNFRLIAAANENLKQMVKEKKFRQDLYYRLDVLHHEIPPLRSRKEDIKYIVQSYLIDIGRNISDAAQKKLSSYNWPGNIRELRNCLDRACSLASSGEEIDAYHIEF